MAKVKMVLKVEGLPGGVEKVTVHQHLTPGSSCKTQDNAAILEKFSKMVVPGFGSPGEITNLETTPEFAEMLGGGSMVGWKPEDAPATSQPEDHMKQTERDRATLGYDT